MWFLKFLLRWCQLFVAEASSLVLRSLRLCFWGGPHLVLDPSAVCCLRWVTIGTDITACLSQLFGTWVHWWRRVPLWRCRKNRKPRLDFSSRCLTSFEAHLWTHQYFWLRRVVLTSLFFELASISVVTRYTFADSVVRAYSKTAFIN